MDAYIKRPSATLRVEFDMRVFAASVSPEIVTYVIRCEAGLTITDRTTIVGLLELDVGAGLAGRVYQFGVEATTPSGQSRVDMRKMRLVDVALPSALTPSSVLIPGSLYLDLGALLLDSNYLVLT